MKPNNVDGESRVEILKLKVERCIERKDREMRSDYGERLTIKDVS